MHHCPLAGTYCAYPRRDGQAELTWVISSLTLKLIDLIDGDQTNR